MNNHATFKITREQLEQIQQLNSERLERRRQFKLEYIKEKYGSKLPDSMYQAMDHDSFIEFAIGDGWIPLVVDLHKKLLELSLEYQIVQVKEKFGMLRYYVAIINPEFEDMPDVCELISEAESRSGTICEECGEPGTLRTGGWLKTLCDKHAEERNK